MDCGACVGASSLVSRIPALPSHKWHKAALRSCGLSGESKTRAHKTCIQLHESDGGKDADADGGEGSQLAANSCTVFQTCRIKWVSFSISMVSKQATYLFHITKVASGWPFGCLWFLVLLLFLLVDDDL